MIAKNLIIGNVIIMRFSIPFSPTKSGFGWSVAHSSPTFLHMTLVHIQNTKYVVNARSLMEIDFDI